MIKRIVFDLDNTLIDWKDEYIFALERVLKILNITYTTEMLYNFDKAIVEYEKYHKKYSKKTFVDFINYECKSNLPLNFVELLIEEQGKCYEKDPELVEVMQYLSEKYDLVLLSNWFTKTQYLRLKGVGISKYFSIISGGDKHLLKPDLLAFKEVLANYKAEECLMVGDSLNSDIIPALKLGMNAIWVSKEQNSKYQTINNVYELKKIL